MRTLVALTVLASSCVVYRTSSTETIPCGPACETIDPEPEDPELFLSIVSANPGQELLTTLHARPGVDLSSVGIVTFDRDVAVLDQIIRPDEVVLLLAVAPEAEPGEVGVTVQVVGGSDWPLAEPFRIVAPAASATDTGSDDGCDSSDTSDSGCP